MSVSETIVLPAQPTTGTSRIQPLGGNGYSAPMSMAFCEADLASDASGGYNRLIFELEEGHAHMIGIVGMRVASASAAVVAAPTIRAGASMSWRDTVTIPEAAVLTQARVLWRPPPLWCRAAGTGTGYTPQLEVYVPNVNGETFRMSMLAYQFQPEASQVTAWPFLVANFAS